jgi:hypothetical protein
MFDILKFVTAIAEGRDNTDYTKVVTRLTRKVITDQPESMARSSACERLLSA